MAKKSQSKQVRKRFTQADAALAGMVLAVVLMLPIQVTHFVNTSRVKAESTVLDAADLAAEEEETEEKSNTSEAKNIPYTTVDPSAKPTTETKKAVKATKAKTTKTVKTTTKKSSKPAVTVVENKTTEHNATVDWGEDEDPGETYWHAEDED